MKDNKNNDDSTSLDKGITLLRRIAQDRGKTPFKTLATNLNLPLSTAHRLLATLERHGLINRIGRGHYDIGKTVPDLANGRNAQDILIQIARPLLQRLSLTLRNTVHLGILDQDMVTYLIKAVYNKSKNEKILTRESTQLEAYCSGIGKVLLAQLSATELENYLENGPFIALTKYTIIEPKKLQTVITNIQQQGFSRDDREISEDLYCLAVPIGPCHGEFIVGLSVSLEWNPNIKDKDPVILDHLYKTSTQISEKFFRHS